MREKTIETTKALTVILGIPALIILSCVIALWLGGVFAMLPIITAVWLMKYLEVI